MLLYCKHKMLDLIAHSVTATCHEMNCRSDL